MHQNQGTFHEPAVVHHIPFNDRIPGAVHQGVPGDLLVPVHVVLQAYIHQTSEVLVGGMHKRGLWAYHDSNGLLIKNRGRNILIAPPPYGSGLGTFNIQNISAMSNNFCHNLYRFLC